MGRKGSVRIWNKTTKPIISRSTHFSGVRRRLGQRSKSRDASTSETEELTGQCLFREGPEKAEVNRKFPQ